MKKTLCMLLTLVMVLSLAACSGGSSGTQPAQTETPAAEAPAAAAPQEEAEKVYDSPEFELIMAGPYPLENLIGAAGQQICDQVFEKTNGRVKINYFYGSSLYNEKDANIACSNSEIDFCLGGVQLISQFAPGYDFFACPFLISSEEQFFALMNGEVGDNMRAELEKSNLRQLAVAGSGWRHFESAFPVNSAADFAGAKLRVAEVPALLACWKAVGAETKAIASAEVYTSLQSGLINATELGYAQFTTMGIADQMGYVTELNHIYDFGAITACNANFTALPEEIQTIIQETATEAFQEATEKVAVAEQEAKDTLFEQYDYTLCQLSDEEIQKIAEMVKPVLDNYFATSWDGATYDEIMSYAVS